MALVSPAHHPLARLAWLGDDGWFEGSRVLLSAGPAVHTAIVFLHGWGGNAGDTWETFPSALRSTNSAAAADAFFLQYPSREHSVAVCGAKVASLLLDVLRAPGPQLAGPSLLADAPPRGPFNYTRVIVVGHSMGAVVARRALLDLDRDSLTDQDRSRIRLLFFAPAHKGSTLP